MADACKVILFIVEGPSDESALGGLFRKIFADSSVKFDVIHGDIVTTCSAVGKIRDHVRDEVVNHLSKDRGYTWKDLARIVMISDTDGAFVPDELVHKSGDGKLHYGLEHIEAGNVESIRKRNHKKQECLNRLRDIGALTYKRVRVPFRTFYLSRNLEHALSNEPGECTNEDKELLAHRFARKYRDDIEGFKSFLREEIAVSGTYKETWLYLAEGSNSLSRCSNLHLVLPDSSAVL